MGLECHFRLTGSEMGSGANVADTVVPVTRSEWMGRPGFLRSARHHPPRRPDAVTRGPRCHKVLFVLFFYVSHLVLIYDHIS